MPSGISKLQKLKFLIYFFIIWKKSQLGDEYAETTSSTLFNAKYVIWHEKSMSGMQKPLCSLNDLQQTECGWDIKAIAFFEKGNHSEMYYCIQPNFRTYLRVVGWGKDVVYLASLGRLILIGLQLGKACYPCSK